MIDYALAAGSDQDISLNGFGGLGRTEEDALKTVPAATAAGTLDATPPYTRNMKVPRINLRLPENDRSLRTRVAVSTAELDRGWKATLLGLGLLLVYVVLLPI